MSSISSGMLHVPYAGPRVGIISWGLLINKCEKKLYWK